jgi:hypothetical protein
VGSYVRIRLTGRLAYSAIFRRFGAPFLLTNCYLARWMALAGVILLMV